MMVGVVVVTAALDGRAMLSGLVDILVVVVLRPTGMRDGVGVERNVEDANNSSNRSWGEGPHSGPRAPREV